MSKPRKRKGSPYYWYDFTVGGNRFRGSTETDCFETAKAIVAKLKSDLVTAQHFGRQKPKISLDTAFGRFLIEHAQYLKSYESYHGHLAKMLAYMGGSTMLHEVDDALVSRYRAHRRALTNRKGERTISDTTINREMEVLRKLMNMAREEWGVECAGVNFKKHMYREPEARTRWITHSEAEALINCAAVHLRPIIHFALLTGLRRGNITGLKWEDVKIEAREMNFRIKSNIPGGKLLTLPITDDIMRLLVGIGIKSRGYVFTYEGKPVRIIKRAFATACKGAGLTDFRFHDLRHTAASWMVQSGVPIDLVKEVLGHTNIYTTSKYAHRDQSERLKALDAISFAPQSRHNDPRRTIKKKRKTA